MTTSTRMSHQCFLFNHSVIVKGLLKDLKTGTVYGPGSHLRYIYSRNMYSEIKRYSEVVEDETNYPDIL